MGNTGFVPESGMSFAFDDRARMESAFDNSPYEQHFQYNGAGERTLKSTVAGVSTVVKSAQYLYNEDGAIATIVDVDSATSAERYRSVIYLEGIPVGLIDTGTPLAIETDHLGTPRAVAAPEGVVWRWELVTGTTSAGGSNAFGDRPPNEDVDGDGKSYAFELRFPGQIHDPETGLHYNYFRDYEPGTGRYLESDPIGLAGGVSTYGYARTDPTNYIDPTGLLTVIVINNNYYPYWGYHAGMWILRPGEKPLMIDPAGSYCGECGEGAELDWKDFFYYLRYQLTDGPHVRAYPFNTTRDQEREIIRRMDLGGTTSAGYCAVTVQNLIDDVGPFKDLPRSLSPHGLGSSLHDRIFPLRRVSPCMSCLVPGLGPPGFPR